MSCKLVVSLLLLVLFEAVSAQSSWCNVESCKKKGQQTLCAYPNPFPAQKCKAKRDLLGLGGNLSKADQQFILNFHNHARQRAASGVEIGANGPLPKAKSGTIPDLKWDNELADIAQRWADQCENKHDSCRDTHDYKVGQNIAEKDTSENAIRDMLVSWYNEVQSLDKNEVEDFDGKLTGDDGKYIGDYTQMIWQDTTVIGCGLRIYYEDGSNRSYLVCNYGPEGNIRGDTIYDTENVVHV